jgi:hypothetical protein
MLDQYGDPEPLPIEGLSFQTDGQGEWKTESVRPYCRTAESPETLRYWISFRQVDGPGIRRLELRLNSSLLKIEKRQGQVLRLVREWLEWNEGDGEFSLSVDPSTNELKIDAQPSG